MQKVQLLPSRRVLDLRDSSKHWKFLPKSRIIIPIIKEVLKAFISGDPFDISDHSLECFFRDPTIVKTFILHKKFLDDNQIPWIYFNQSAGEMMVTQELHQHQVDNFGDGVSCSGFG